MSTRLALHLNAMGLKLYDRVILQIPSIPEAVVTYLATLKAGVSRSWFSLRTARLKLATLPN